MAFDIENEKNRPIVNYLASKKVLVVGTSQSLRATFRAFAKAVAIGKVLNATTLSEAMVLLEEEKPEIIITEFIVSGKQITPLITKHKELLPNRLQCITVFVGESGLSPAPSKALDEEIDIFITKPFTVDKLEQQFINEVVVRLRPSQEKLIMDEVNALFLQGEHEKCLELVDDFLNDAPKSPVPYGFKGNVLFQMGKHDEAAEYFKKGLEFSSTDYKCLKGLYEYYVYQKKHKEAYDTIDTLLKHHPFNPNRLPEITKVFIANEKFRDVIRYCDKFVNWDQFDNMDESEDKSETIAQIQNNVSACMIVSAKFLIKEQRKKEAVESLKKAAMLSQSNYTILSKVIGLFTDMKQYELAEKWFNKVPSDKITNEMKVSKLEIDDTSMEAGEVLKSALFLLEKGVKERAVFEIVIKRSIEIGRRKEIIEDIVDDAVRHFPESETLFKNYTKAI